MDEQFGISRGDVEAAEAETARKLAADRAVELESPALRTYVSENPDADMTLLKFMDEMKTKSDLAAQESRQQVDALREQIVQMRQKPTTQGAAFEALKANARASEKLAEAVGNSINKSHSVTSKAPESLIRFIQEYPLDDRADFGVQVEEMLRSMYDIYAPLIILGSSSYTGAEFGNECWNEIKRNFIGQLPASMQTTADKAKESFFDGTTAYYLTDAGRRLLLRVTSEEVKALDAHGASKWTKHINAPGNENEFREAYLFPNKPSYLVYRSAIAKCIVFMWYL